VSPRSRTEAPRPPRRRPRRSGAALLVLALAASTASCARRALPSGGPLDVEPPFITGSSPDSGAAHVARNARLSVTFSENMEPRSTSESVALAPNIEIRQRRWSGRTMTVVLAESLKASHVYTMFLGTGARDAHGNNLTASGGTVTLGLTGTGTPSGVTDHTNGTYTATLTAPTASTSVDGRISL